MSSTFYINIKYEAKIMKFKKYLTELSMQADTQIEKHNIGRELEYRITLAAGPIFKLYIGPEKSHLKTGEEIERHGIAFTDNRGNTLMSPKDKGVSIQLFAAIQSIVSEFVKSEKPILINFSGNSKEKSKLKLYSLLAKKIEKSGYTLQTKDNHVTKYYFDHAYDLMRNDVYKEIQDQLR